MCHDDVLSIRNCLLILLDCIAANGISYLNLAGNLVTCTNISNIPAHITRLNFNHCKQFSNFHLSHLKLGLEHLSIACTDITDEGIAHIPKTVKILDISNTMVTDATLSLLPPSLFKLLIVGVCSSC